MLRIILPLSIALLAQTLPAQETNEQLKGLLWEVSGNNIAKLGYLYGTMHVPEKMAFNLSDSFFVALRQADMVALETDHDRWQEFTEMLDGRESELFNPRYGNGYSGGRSMAQPNLYNSQFQFAVPENQMLGAMLSAKPRLTNEFLYRSNQYRQDYEEDTYLDLFIFQAGRKLGKKVIGLETLEGSYEALVRAQMPDEDEAERDRPGYYPGQFSRQTLEDAYRDQDLSLMDSLNKLSSPSKNFQRWMLDERNLIMVDGIDSILQSGTSLFSAVGAAHLPGETGLIRALRERGYTLRPVQFSSETSKADKEAIEAMQHPVQFNRQWAADSTWSVEAPGKFYQTVDGMGLEQQLYADMSNGAYYAVYRLHSYGMWNGQSPAYIAERIDSLIYEKIPGKIQERKRFNSPFPGHEILTRTRRGDIIRYKVFATPMEVFVFATGGNGEYAGGKEGARFINSIQFHRQHVANERQTTRVEPAHGGFQVDMPAPAVINTTQDKQADLYLVGAVDPTDSAFYLLYRATFHDWDFIEEDSFELNIIIEKVAEQFTKSTPEYTLVASSPYPTQDASFRSDQDSAYYYLRLVIEGPHYYLLGCRKNQPGAPSGFFNSFSILPDRYPQGWELLRDTNMLFEAMVPKAALKPEKPFLELLQRIIQEGMSKSNRNSDYSDSRPQNLYKVLELPLQGDAVSISSFPMVGAGSANTLDSFQSFVVKMLTDGGKMRLREKHWDPPTDTLLTGHFLVEDTNSTRGIRAKIVLTPGQYYTLLATVHLDGPASTLVDKVFDSFTPTDTTHGSLPLGRRDLNYLSEIYAVDSLVREKALDRLENTYSSKIEAGDYPAYRRAIEHPEFSKLKMKYRLALLRSLGAFNKPEQEQYVLQLLQKHPDSMRYQQALLGVLAELQTPSAQQALLAELKKENQYLTGSTISVIFGFFGDSLELSIKRLKDLLELADREVYREEVTTLVHRALTRGLLKPKQYSRLKPRLIRESYWSLGQQQFEAEQKKDSRQDDPYRDYYPSYSRSDYGNLQRNLQLLAPFLEKDSRVRDLFAQAVKSPEKEVQILAMSLQLQEGRLLREKTLHAFADDDRTRYMLYRHLAEVDQLSTRASWFADTLALVRSILFEETLERRDNGDSTLDSVRFLSRHQTTRYNSPALVYFFEVKKQKDKEWRLAYVNVPLNSDLFGYSPKSEQDSGYNNYDRSYRQRPEVKLLSNLPEKEKAEYIRKKVGEIRFANRERYRKWDGGEDYYFEE